jgi:glyoxylase-like metal-dependent hydrolase (beta-lactamase superfamily II)
MNLGGYSIKLIEAGDFGLDGGAMFGVVPKNLWQKAYSEADDKNRIKLSTRLMYMEGHGKKILVDTGNGTKLADKLVSIYGIDPADLGAAHKLMDVGINPDEITDVILTHLHFDHVGGATELDGKGNPVPAFRNAKYHVQKEQLDWARNPTIKDRASFMPENYEPIVNEGMLETLDGEGELFPNIHVFPIDGHTKGMQMLKISGDRDSLVYFADLAPTSAHLSLPYVMGYDNEPLKTLAEKEKYVLPAAEDKNIVVFEHDAYTKFGRLTMSDRGPKVENDSSINFD